jgi:OOP family OmpA-OmpF porin
MGLEKFYWLAAVAWILLVQVASTPSSWAAPAAYMTGSAGCCPACTLEGPGFFEEGSSTTVRTAFRLRGPKDSDADGVDDRQDACPDTPAGAAVDARGCPADEDQDGVFDGLDQCGHTARGATVDTAGCPRDSDGDGILDGLDMCPDTDQRALVNEDGCPFDTDGDGFLDGIDQCPDTPMGVLVDDKGCRIDSDGDGVPDGIDRCPDTSLDDRPDESGCSAVQRGQFVLPAIRFGLGSSAIRPGSSTALDEVARILKQNPDLVVEIEGHTDNEGPAKVNRAISLQRAEEVKAYLVSQGVPTSRLTTKGYGEVHPIASNRDAKGRAENRRIEFKVLSP